MAGSRPADHGALYRMAGSRPADHGALYRMAGSRPADHGEPYRMAGSRPADQGALLPLLLPRHAKKSRAGRCGDPPCAGNYPTTAPGTDDNQRRRTDTGTTGHTADHATGPAAAHAVRHAADPAAVTPDCATSNTDPAPATGHRTNDDDPRPADDTTTTADPTPTNPPPDSPHNAADAGTPNNHRPAGDCPRTSTGMDTGIDAVMP